MYHGWGRKDSFFEGWYFKLVDAKERHVFAVIPGVAIDKRGEPHAFIQVMDGKACKANYHSFPADQFKPRSNGFYVEIGNNSFSGNHIELDLPELSGRIDFQELTPWPKMLGAPGIMGWYSFVPFMQCFHGVVSLHHRLDGKMKMHGLPIATDFSNGLGYIEKDWGTSFPRSYIWMHSNHFDGAEKMSLLASVAHIPWLNGYFIGYIVGFQIGDKLHRFATYTGAKMKAGLEEQSVYVSFMDSRYRLEITGLQAPGAVLMSPLTGEMKGKVNESMQGTLYVRFYDQEKLVYDGLGRHAGLEVAGDVAELLTQEWRR